MHLAASFIVPRRLSLVAPFSFRLFTCCSSLCFSSPWNFLSFSIVFEWELLISWISSSNIFLWFINVSSYSSLIVSYIWRKSYFHDLAINLTVCWVFLTSMTVSSSFVMSPLSLSIILPRWLMYSTKIYQCVYIYFRVDRDRILQFYWFYHKVVKDALVLKWTANVS